MEPHDTTVEFRDAALPLSDLLRAMADSIEGHLVTVRDLLALSGEHGMLLALILLTIPFLVPISIPGISTAFGLVGIFIAISIVVNRVPWLPERLLDHPVHTEHLVPAIHKGAGLVHRIDRVSHLRLERLTTGAAVHRANGLGLLLGNVLLLFPLGLVPFSNTLPGWSILLLAVGMVQRDGLLILAGWLFLIATIVYFAVLAVIALATGQGLVGFLQ